MKHSIEFYFDLWYFSEQRQMEDAFVAVFFIWALVGRRTVVAWSDIWFATFEHILHAGDVV